VVIAVIVVIALVGGLGLLGLSDRRAKARGHTARGPASIAHRAREGKRDARVVNTVAGALQRDVEWTEAVRRDHDGASGS